MDTVGSVFQVFKLFSDEGYRGQIIGLVFERAIPISIGMFVIVVGVAFVLAGTTAGKAAGSIVEIVATKGGSIAKAIK